MDLLLSSGYIDITPVKPVPLSGFAERHGSYSFVHDPLEINLLVLQQQDKKVLIYSVDTLFVPEAFVQEIVTRFGAVYNFAEKDVWMVASHTHFAPALDREKPELGKINEQYYNDVLNKLLQLTQQVLSSIYEKVTVEYGHVISALNVNRRKKLLRPGGKLGVKWKTLIYPDYNGIKDSNIHAVSLVNDEGAPRAILWNYACHPVGFVHRSQVTAEFPGIIRQEMRGHYKNDSLPVAFMIGFAGNLKPDVTAITRTRFVDTLRYLLQVGPKYTRFKQTQQYLDWAELLWKEVKNALEKSKPAGAGALQTAQVTVSLGDIMGHYKYPVYFKKLTITPTIQFIGISAEVLAEYRDVVADALGKPGSINVGCLAGTRIYLPADKNVREGGYEVKWFQHRFGVKGHFHAGLDEKVRQVVASL